MGLREEVEGLSGETAITVIEQGLEIPGLGGGVAGDVEDARRAEIDEFAADVARSLARRIENDEIER